MDDLTKYPLTRRRALGVLASPFVAACLADRALGPKLSLSQADSFVTLIGAGDQHAAPNNAARARTAAMIKAVLDADPSAWAFNAGDLVHRGTAQEYQDYYHPTWGAFRERTLFCIGNHDTHYADPPGAAYYAYTGAPKYFAQTLGAWRCYVLNCEPASKGGAYAPEQTAWLRADLAEHPNFHYLAIWHYPMFNNVCDFHLKAMTWPGKVGPWWQVLQDAGAEFVISGHAHRWERFRRKLRDGTVSSRGIRQFVVGTGGVLNRGILSRHPDCESVVVAKGVVRFDLYPDRYEWTFTDLAGVVRDSGSQLCRRVL